jgi:hypothetical protein
VDARSKGVKLQTQHQKVSTLLETIKKQNREVEEIIFMGREKDKKLNRKRRRKRKLRKLKLRLSQAKTDSERRKLIEKIRRISVTNKYIPEF